MSAVSAVAEPQRAALSDALLQDPRLFRAGRSQAAQNSGLPSGLAALDAVLPWGGFPRGALTELLYPHDGIGELSLLLPALRRLAADEPLVLLNPPYLPYAPALQQQGVPLSRLLWLAPPAERVLWTAEQCLRAGCLSAVLLWHGGGDVRPLRRLQVAAESGRSLAFLFRPLKHLDNPSPAALRLQVGRDQLQVLKCRGAVALAQPIARPRPALGGTLPAPASRPRWQAPVTPIAAADTRARSATAAHPLPAAC